MTVTTTPLGAGAGGAARAVQVRLVLGRRVDVHDQRDVVDVDAAGGDVGRARAPGLAPLLNASRLRSRAFWLRLPCRSTAGMPGAVSCLASFLAWCLVRVNSTLRPRPEASSRTTSALSAVCTCEHVVGHRADRRDGRVDRVRRPGCSGSA